MSLFNWSSSKPNASSFGVNIAGKDLPANLEEVKGNILKTSKKYRDEFAKYRDIAKFNQQLSNSYIRNLEAMVDVSKVLNYYVEIINVISEEYRKNQEIMGNSLLKPEDISYLEKLTKSKIDELNQTFSLESDKLKKLYGQFGKTNEIARLEEAKRSMLATTDFADATYSQLRSAELATPVTAGGGRSKGSNVKKVVASKKQEGPKKKRA